jgi:hypothetical protein
VLTCFLRTPFYFLDPAFEWTKGHARWRRRLRDLIDVAGLDRVSKKVMCVEHFPYKSTSYQPLGCVLPSQNHSLASQRLFDVDILAINESNGPVIIECKWDLVGESAFEQLACYKSRLFSGWDRFEARISKVRAIR